MTGHRSERRERLSREELRAELDRACEHIADLEADRPPHECLLDGLAVHLNEGLSLMSPAGVQLDVNPAFCAMTGFTREELVGLTSPQPYWPPEHRDAHLRRFRQLATEEPTNVEVTFIRKNGERFPVLITPRVLRDRDGQPFGLVAAIKDISELRAAEVALQRLNRELQAVNSCNQVLMQAADEETLLRDICQIVCDEAGYPLAWVGYGEHDKAKTVRPVAWAGADGKSLAAARISWADSPRGRGATGTAIRSGTSICFQGLASDPRTAPWRESALQGGYRSCLALPLKDENAAAFGALSIYSRQADAFTPDETRLLEGLAGDLAFGITSLRARREAKRAEEERQARIRFLEAMERVDRAIRQEPDVEQMLQNVLETVLSIFESDRAWLFYPCDPDAPSFRVPMEVTRPEYPGANALNVDVPMHPSIARDIRNALASEDPFTETNGTNKPVNLLSAEQFGVQAQMFQAVYPRTGKPWVFGMHQCSHARAWTEDERQRFKEVGRRVADGLSNVLLLRDLRVSEERLSAAAAEWSATFDAMNDSVALFDSGGKVLRCNAATAELTGRSYDEIIGRACHEVFHGSEEWHRSCPQLQARVSLRSESAVLEQDGRWLRVTFQPMSDAAGNYSGGVHVVSDVTELTQAEQALRASETRFRSLFEDAPIAMWEEDHSAVKIELERLLTSGVGDIAAYLRSHPAEYLHCLEAARTLDVNRAAVQLFEATDRQELMARANALYLAERPGNLCLFWAALLAGERSMSYEETNLTLRGESIEVLETCTLAPGGETSWERVYIDDADITALKQAEHQVQQSLSQLQSVFDEVIAVIAAIVEARDPYTAGHQQRVSELAAAIARQMGLGENDVSGIRVGGILHDIGKISVPAEILSKPAALTTIEFDLIKTHPRVAHDLLGGIEFPWPVAEMALQHHERLDGSGYPQGLGGEEIVLEARILAVADVVEAIASHRPYRPALGIEAALEEIATNRGRLYDPLVVDACLALVHEGGFFFEADAFQAG